MLTYLNTNSKLHDRAEIEQNTESKRYQSILADPKTVFKPYPDPKNSPLGPKKLKNDPKIKSKSNVGFEENIDKLGLSKVGPSSAELWLSFVELCYTKIEG